MKLKHEQVVEWLGKVRLQGSEYNFHRLLNDEEKSRIASIVTQEMNQWLHKTLVGEE